MLQVSHKMRFFNSVKSGKGLIDEAKMSFEESKKNHSKDQEVKKEGCRFKKGNPIKCLGNVSCKATWFKFLKIQLKQMPIFCEISNWKLILKANILKEMHGSRM